MSASGGIMIVLGHVSRGVVTVGALAIACVLAGCGAGSPAADPPPAVAPAEHEQPEEGW